MLRSLWDRIRGRKRPRSLIAWITELVQAQPVQIERILEGEVLIQGWARPGPVLLEAPLSGISVIGFRVTVEAHDVQGSRRVVDYSRVVDFEVQDATGHALIRTKEAQMLLQHEYSGASETAPPAVISLVNKLGAVDWRRRPPHRFTWAEHYLEPGEPVVAYGMARQEIDPSKEPVGYRQSATRLVLVKPKQAPLFFADQTREDLLRQLGD